MDTHLLYQNLAVIAAFLLIYGLIAGNFESKLVNGPLLNRLAAGARWAGTVLHRQ